MTPDLPDRETRAAENEDLFRRLNERLHVLANVAASAVEASELPERFLCECAQARCSQVIGTSPIRARLASAAMPLGSRRRTCNGT